MTDTTVQATVAEQLEKEIVAARRTIVTDGYQMSIGELTNMYVSGELIIRPEFQRFFRWSSHQKSRLVESLLLGIPIPSLFVAQTESGKWELVDGLQRVATMLELQGRLLEPDGQLAPQLALEPTKYLPSLGGRTWDNPDPAHSLTDAQRLDLKRTRLDVKIVKRDSSPEAKYDLFQRLNSYGSELTAQETRSALLVAASPDFFAWLEGLAQHASFVATTGLSERLVEQRYDLELVLRFLVLHDRPESRLSVGALRDFGRVLDDEAVEMANEFPRGRDQRERAFRATFDHIGDHGGDSVLRRWSPRKLEFEGSFLNTSFEVFALGLGYHIARSSPVRQDLLDLVKEFWARPEMQRGFATGKSTESRLARFVPIGRGLVGARAQP